MNPESIVFNCSYVLCVLDFVVISLMYVSMPVCLSVCVSVCICVFPPTEAISQPILKCDTWLNASSSHLGSYVHTFINYTGWFEKNAPKV